MEKDNRFTWLIRLSNSLLVLLVLFIIMKLSPMWSPVLDVIIRVFIPLMIAGLITYLLHPIIERFHGIGVPRPVAVLLIYFTFFGGLATLFVTGSPYIYTQIKDMIEQLPIWLEEVNRWANWFNRSIDDLPPSIQNRLQQWIVNLEGFAEDGAERIGQILIGLFNSLIYFIIIPFLVFYFLKDYKLMEKVAWYLTPRKWRRKGRTFIRDVDQSFGSFIRGQIIVSVCVGTLATIGLWIIGVPYPIVLGLFIGITDIIPYFGPFIGAVPAILVAAFQSWDLLLFTVILIFILQQIEGNILSPIIVGKQLHLHPVLIMIALITGVEIGGIGGLILAVPTLAIGKVVALHLRQNLSND